VALDPRSPALVMDALSLFNYAKEKKRPLLKKWITNYNVVHNRTWSKFRGTGYPKTEIPEIYPILASITAWETDQNPQYSVTSEMPPNSPFAISYATLAKDLEWILNTNWEALDYSNTAQTVLWDGEMYGIGFAKNIWSPHTTGGLGDVQMCRVDPFNMYLDPDARAWKDVQFLIETKTCTKEEVKKRFPKARVDELYFSSDTPDGPTQLDQTNNPGAQRPNLSRFPTPTTTNNPTTTNVTSTKAKYDMPSSLDNSNVVIMEMWYQKLTNSGLTNDNDPTPETPNKSEKQNEWFCLVFCGDQILMHKSAEELMGVNMHPYARYCPLEEGELYGYSLVEQLAPMQISINRLFASVEQNAWLSGNPILVQKDGRRTSISNRPGEKIEVNDPNQDVRWLTPPSISAQHIEVINKLIEEMERISGMSAIVRGASPEGRPSEGVVNTIQDSAFVRIRQRLRNYERFLRECALMQASLITQFYDQDRVMSRIGDDGEGTSLQITESHFYVPGPDGVEPLKYNLRVRAGASDAIGREARLAMYERLFAIGAIDHESLLKLSRIPGWHEIAQKVTQEKTAAGTMGQPPTQRAAARR